jgi:hypothetical protein
MQAMPFDRGAAPEPGPEPEPEPETMELREWFAGRAGKVAAGQPKGRPAV